MGLQFNGDLELKNITIKDHRLDTLFSISELNTSIISLKNLYNGKLTFGDISIEALVFNLKTYKDESQTNLDVFVDKFEDDNPRQGPSGFLLSSSDITIANSTFRLTNENLETPDIFQFYDLNTNTTNFLIKGPKVNCRINTLNFKDSRGVTIKNLKANFEYDIDHMSFNALSIETKNSKLQGDLKFNYKREDLQYFTDKVKLEANFKDSRIALTELNAFFDEFGTNQIVKLNTELSGTLNQLEANSLDVSTSRNTKLRGDIVFKGLFNKADDSFSLKGNFKNLSSNYNDLVALMPKILGRSLPTLLSKVGNFRILGTSTITAKQIQADLDIHTAIGDVTSNLELTNIDDIDNASYLGNVILDNFNLGELLNDPLVGLTSLNFDVDGKGFTVDNLLTSVDGELSSLQYNNYNYTNIKAKGEVGNKVFNGVLTANDPNLKLLFNGLADFSKNIKSFDFNADVGYANLKALNFVVRDNLSEFKGKVRMRAQGSSYENATGDVNIQNTTYKNQDATYKFTDFDIVSTFTNDVRTITINSPDIIEGKVYGKFNVKDIVSLIENSIGSIYTNYVPHNLEDNQFLEFNFNIYSKIAAVFFKDLYVSKNTFIKGRIETEEKAFKLNFTSPQIKFQDYFVNNFNITVDNSNPIYNTFIEADSLSTGAYNASEFRLVNVTKRDTLLIKSKFKGGALNRDDFNLNMYYTIDENNKSVVGFRKSEIKFKENNWYINNQKDTLNKVTFDRAFKGFNFFPIKLNQGKEEILISGQIKNQLTKNFKVDFTEVQLQKITPRIDSLSMGGIVNGYIDIQQRNGIYVPKSDINVSSLILNDYNMGDLSAKVEGKNSLTNYDIDIRLLNNSIKSIDAKGNVNLDKNKPKINLDVTLDEFLLNPLNPLGEGVISNIRGLVSGNAKITGSLKRPSIDGELLLDQAGLSIPYLNVDYGFGFDSKVTLKGQQFLFNNVAMTDSKFFSKGYLNGFIEHQNFSDWELGLELNTDRLLVLNTSETEDSLYYGDAFITGEASITGPTGQLLIDVEGATAKGTVFNIPLNDSESFGDNSFIHFLTPEEKKAKIKGDVVENIEVKGLELNFDLAVNENALIEILIDKEAGSTIKGKGFGFLGFIINTTGTFNMWGDFQVVEGVYNFKYGGIVEKRFDVEPGGNIVWNGSPLQAEINLNALYKTAANPSILLDNPISQRIPVEVEIQLTGQLEKPEPNFDLRFPNVTSTLKSELDYRLSAKDERDFQALTLLGTGSFSGANRSVDFTGTISERLSGIVNNLIGADNENLNVGLDLELGQDTPDIQTNNRVGLTLETKINEKVLVNGRFGVPFGSAQQTTITGDVQIDWLLNEDGSLRAKVFNRENIIRNFGEEIGYTQGLGLSYSVEFNTFKELIQIIFSGKNRKDKVKKPQESSLNTPQDANLPDYISWKKKTNKTGL